MLVTAILRTKRDIAPIPANSDCPLTPQTCRSRVFLYIRFFGTRGYHLLENTHSEIPSHENFLLLKDKVSVYTLYWIAGKY